MLISMYVIEPYAVVVTGLLQVTPLIQRVLNKIMIFGWSIKTFVLCLCFNVIILLHERSKDLAIISL